MPGAAGVGLLSGERVAALALACWVGACARPPLATDLVATMRGHSEVSLSAAGALVPVFLGWESTAGLCVYSAHEAAAEPRSWEARLSLAGQREGESFHPPNARTAQSQCFDLPWTLAAEKRGELELCAELRDAVSGKVFRMPCQRLLKVADDEPFREPYHQLLRLKAGPGEGALETWLEALDQARVLAEARGARLGAQQMNLVAASYATTAGRWEESERRLAALPAWLDQPAASSLAATRDFEAARLVVERWRRWGDAWQLLLAAERLAVRDANPLALEVARAQAQLLGHVGALDEAEARLTEALGDCAAAPCHAEGQAAARGLLAWLRLLDPDASAEKLDLAAADLAASTAPDGGDGLEEANLRVNLAYLAVRRGGDGAVELAAARRLLAPLPPSDRRRLLSGWTFLVEGLGALRAGDGERAFADCSRVLAAGAPVELMSRALSCAGEAQRRLGDRAGALRSFEQALLFHEIAAGEPLARPLALGPGQRADDFYQAARAALELGRPDEAWRLLDRLDRLALDEEERGCLARGAGDGAAQAALEARLRRLADQLAALARPASRAEQTRREPLIRAIKTELQELYGQLPACDPASSSIEPAPRELWRAFALPEEALVLGRNTDGRVRLLTRTTVDRRELKTKVNELVEALDRQHLEDAAWRRLAEPLAKALLPTSSDELPEAIHVALYGPLQGVPLAALVIPGEPGGRFLAEVTTVVSLAVQRQRIGPAAGGPAATRDPAEAHETAAAGGLAFVVDPQQNLPTGSELAGLYRRLFPQARLLAGEAATRAAVAALGGDGSSPLETLHLDAHGLYDARFPELSSLELADGAVGGRELAAWLAPSTLVNLSGCQTGRWPTTADSGRYGLAGFFLRRGTPWVIASATNLDDRMARSFNAAFYRQRLAGAEVPAAFSAALRGLVGDHPAASWGGLLLLQGFSPGRGQSGAEVTPLIQGRVSAPPALSKG